MDRTESWTRFGTCRCDKDTLQRQRTIGTRRLGTQDTCQLWKMHSACCTCPQDKRCTKTGRPVAGIGLGGTRHKRTTLAKSCCVLHRGTCPHHTQCSWPARFDLGSDRIRTTRTAAVVRHSVDSNPRDIPGSEVRLCVLGTCRPDNRRSRGRFLRLAPISGNGPARNPEFCGICDRSWY